MHHYTTIGLGAMLLTLVGSQSLAEARRPQPQPSTLTTQETVCQLLGNAAHTAAQARDNGMPYLQAVALFRQHLTSTDTMAVLLRDATLANLRLIYHSPGLTPLEIRNNTELVCVDMMEKALAKQKAAQAQQQ